MELNTTRTRGQSTIWGFDATDYLWMGAGLPWHFANVAERTLGASTETLLGYASATCRIAVESR